MLTIGAEGSDQPDGDSSGDQEMGERRLFEKSCVRNFALLVEDRRIWVSRECLAELSEVFREMFYGGSKETLTEVELLGRKVNEIVELLRVIIPDAERNQLKPVTCELFPFGSRILLWPISF